MKIQAKIVLIVGSIFIATFILFGWSVYYFTDNYSYVDFFERLEARVRIAAKINLGSDTINAVRLKELKNQHLEHLENEQEYVIQLDQSPTTTKLIRRYSFSNEFISDILANGKAQEKRGKLFYVGSLYKKNNKRSLVIVSAENYYVTHHLLFLRKIIFASGILLIITIVSLSIYLSRHIFDPIKRIINNVKQISTENIHLRLEHYNQDEISELVNTFNELLDRIETSFETQKNFISNASHELGTPLTAILGKAEVTLLKTRTTEEYQDALNKIVQQAERLDQITKSLLFLAQTGYTGKAIVFEKLRIDEILWETKAVIDQLNPENQLIFNLQLLPEDPKKLKINGNKQLLHLAFANILSNACKYSSNQPVQVFIASSDSHIIVTIKDHGVGIPENELPYIYDPFFRASNTKQFEGYGIGLPLSRNVFKLHKGNINVHSKENEGVTVQIKLPLLVIDSF